MKTFFTSDSHFGHSKIIEYCNRPFKDSHEMDETMITNWNLVVEKEDLVYHLGDVAYGKDKEGNPITREYVTSVLKRLNGKICLIRGNHEELAQKQGNHHRFEWIKDYAEVEVQGQKIVLFHYGMRTWHHDLRGNWHLYGHSHGCLPDYGKSCDVGVDSWGFTPVEFNVLKRKMDSLAIGKHPQFENFVIQK